jgi:hypothetical protein
MFRDYGISQERPPGPVADSAHGRVGVLVPELVPGLPVLLVLGHGTLVVRNGHVDAPRLPDLGPGLRSQQA